MENYSVKETAEILGITERAVQKRCKKDNIRKKDNKYLIDANLIEVWKVEILTSNEPRTNGSQLDIEVESLKAKIKDLETELKQYEIAENERIEVFTNEEYQIFETRLIEWRQQQAELIQKDKIIELTTQSKEEIISFYQIQLNYQRNLAEKQLEQLDKIFELLQGQNQSIQQLNFIQAREKGFDKPK